ncbi:hypothetical protein BB559_006569 [Furculomyces boomerangus]|uniref:Uncharacterized protein n=2 Tax=Harpellales TaxID=61421 RepID=A0A2T9Y1R5_9FUNG|nr:hypothetical protein BB559_006569 [Furculomyces boomerangus]PVZ98807.1 hypothetical protein BB558_005182 [Smittium angustum]
MNGAGQCIQKKATSGKTSVSKSSTENYLYNDKDDLPEYSSEEGRAPKINIKNNMMSQTRKSSNFGNIFGIKEGSSKNTFGMKKESFFEKASNFISNNKLWLFGLGMNYVGEILSITVALSYISTLKVVPLSAISVVSGIFFSNKLLNQKIEYMQKKGCLLIAIGTIIIVMTLPRDYEYRGLPDLCTTLEISSIMNVFFIIYFAIVAVILLYSSGMLDSRNRKVDPTSKYKLLGLAFISSSFATVSIILSKILSLRVSLELLYNNADGLNPFKSVFGMNRYIDKLSSVLAFGSDTILGTSKYNLFGVVLMTANTIGIEKYRQMALGMYKPIQFQIYFFSFFSLLAISTDIIIFQEISGLAAYVKTAAALFFGMGFIIMGFGCLNPESKKLPSHARDVFSSKSPKLE